MTITYDPDLFDACVLLERRGPARYSRDDLAALLGLSRKSIHNMVSRGNLRAPDIAEDEPTNGGTQVYWSKALAARILVDRGMIEQ